MKVRILCDDKYEAQKLSWLIFPKDSKEVFITGILNVIENEVIVSLKDKSAHSVILKNEEQVNCFVDFVQSIIEKEHSIISTKIMDDAIEIIKEKV